MESLRNRSDISPKKLDKPERTDIFMFVNPLSGSREGEAYTVLPTNFYEFEMEGGIQTRLSITNLLESENVESAIKDIAKAVQTRFKNDPTDIDSVIILLCGGDGTFMNMAQELKRNAIDINHLKFAVFPFGTANDIARSFGWGSTPSNKMLENLESVCSEILKAKEEPFDVWEIEVLTNQEEGDIQKAAGEDLVSIDETSMKKYMCHSFSFGSDARAGLAFERKRTRNRFCNRFMYAFEGFKNFIRFWGEPTLKIKQILKR